MRTPCDQPQLQSTGTLRTYIRTPRIRKAKSSWFSVRYSEVPEEVPYSEDRLYGSGVQIPGGFVRSREVPRLKSSIRAEFNCTSTSIHVSICNSYQKATTTNHPLQSRTSKTCFLVLLPDPSLPSLPLSPPTTATPPPRFQTEKVYAHSCSLTLTHSLAIIRCRNSTSPKQPQFYHFFLQKKRKKEKLPMIYLLQVPGGEPALYRQNHHMDGACPNVGVQASKQEEAERERMIAIPSYYTATSNQQHSYIKHAPPPPATTGTPETFC